jgi:hypothetical protein
VKYVSNSGGSDAFDFSLAIDLHYLPTTTLSLRFCVVHEGKTKSGAQGTEKLRAPLWQAFESENNTEFKRIICVMF